MRVFEALCSGSVLLTDRAEGSGLEELFEDGKHLVIYEDYRLTESIRFYLDRPDLMAAIAKAELQGGSAIGAPGDWSHSTTAPPCLAALPLI